MSQVPRIRVLAADDHMIVRLGLVALIESQHDMTVVAQAASGDEAVERYRAHRPDVMLLDLRMPGKDGVAVIETIRADDPCARIVVLTIHSAEEVVYRAIRAGAKGYLLKEVSGDEIVKAIRVVHAGGSWIPAEIADRMVGRVQQPPPSARELEVLKLIAQGFPNKRIADRLAIGETTVRTHVASLMDKLGASNRTHVVTIALERHIIDESDLRDDPE